MTEKFKLDWGWPVKNDDHREHRLKLNGVETPYFITSATTLAGRTGKVKYGLFGAGMKPVDGDPTHSIALELGRGERIAPLKAKAEALVRAGAAG